MANRNHKRRYTRYIPDFVMQNIIDLHAERCARCLTRQDLADKVSLNVTSIADYENGFTWPTQKSYNRLAEVLRWKLWQN